VCIRASLDHYMFCAPWKEGENQTMSCENPYSSMKNFTLQLIDIVKRTGNQHLLDLLTSAEKTIDDLDSCNKTRAVYTEAKQNVCWDVNNATIQITLLYIIQSPILIVLLIYVLSGWYRFNIRRLPYAGLSSKNQNNYQNQGQSLLEDELTDRNEELKNLGNGPSEDDYPDSNQEISQAMFDSTVAIEPNTSTAYMFEAWHKNIRKIVRKNVLTIVFTAAMFLIVFTMIFVWLGILNNDFKVHSTKC